MDKIKAIETGSSTNYSSLLTIANNIANTNYTDDSSSINFNEDEEEICLYKALKILKGVI